MGFDEWYMEAGNLIRKIFRYAIVGDLRDSDDIIQEVALIACQQWEELQHHPNLMGWTVSTARHRICHRQWRQSYWGEELVAESCDSGIEDICLDMSCCMDLLSKDHDGSLIYLHEIAGYTYKELVMVYGVSAVTLRKRCQRAKERLAVQWTFNNSYGIINR